MSETTVPGTAVKHRIVTGECRKRPKREWIDECLASVKEALTDLAEGWPKEKNVNFHVLVTFDRL